MIDVAVLKRDRDELSQELEKLRNQSVQLTKLISQHEGALWYAERMLQMMEQDAKPEPEIEE